MTRYGTLIAGAVALFVAGWDLVREGSDEGNDLALVAMTLGLVLVGAWLAIEIFHLWQGAEPPEEDGPDDQGV